MAHPRGEVAEWLMAADCKSALYEYAGSNPALSTNLNARYPGVRIDKRGPRLFRQCACAGFRKLVMSN